MAPGVVVEAGRLGALVDADARVQDRLPQPPGQPGRLDHGGAVALPQPREVRRGVDLRAHLRRRRAARRRGRPPSAGRPGRRARRPRAGADATLSSPVSSQRAVDAVPSHGVGDRRAGSRRPAGPARPARRASARRRCRSRGSGWPTRTRRCGRWPGHRSARPRAARRRSRGPAPWPAGPPTARCSRRRRRRRSADSGPRSAASGSGRAGSLEPEDRRATRRPATGRLVGAATSGAGVGAGASRRRARAASATRNITVPITLTCGGMPRCAEPHTNIGNVIVLPWLKFVTMKSSNDSEKLSSAAARMPGEHQREGDPPERLPLVGVEVHRRLLQSRSPGPASRALTVTTTNDRQNMMCATRIDQKPSCAGQTGAGEQGQQRGAHHHLGGRHRQEDQQAGRGPPAEPVPHQREGDQRAEEGRAERGQEADLQARDHRARTCRSAAHGSASCPA